jgi:radical SAM superfamily enzyme YgiQ (UPF0313 family)
MRVLLIQPRVSAEPSYPLALAAIIPLLEAEGHAVTGLDLVFDDESEILAMAQSGEVDWVGATVLHHNTSNVQPWMNALRSFPDIRTFVAGALPTLDPLGAIARTGADFAVVGPPERAVADLVSAEDPTHVAGVVHPGRSTPAHRVQPKLNTLPAPDRTVFPVEQYSYAMRSTAVPYTQVFTSRGCIKACPYCPVPTLRPGRFDPKSPEQVVAEWAALVKDHHIASIHVEDDSFLADKHRVHEICDRLLQQNVSVQWELVNGIRIDQVDRNILKKMASSGCVRIVFSAEYLESNQEPAIGHRFKDALNAVQWAQECGMRVGGYFIVGLPGLSARQNWESVRLALRLGLDDANWVPFYETPGSGFSGAATSIDATAIPRAQAVRMAKAAHLAFFTHPRSFGRLASEMIATPATVPTMAQKAWELICAGGPVPMRDTP